MAIPNNKENRSPHRLVQFTNYILENRQVTPCLLRSLEAERSAITLPAQNANIRRNHSRVRRCQILFQIRLQTGYLDGPSQELTTFRTVFGRYCFLRLPFGLASSQDVFQQHMDRIFNRCTGCVGTADDVAVYGKTEEEHDRNLLNLMKVAEESILQMEPIQIHLR